jgi:4-hydroxy-4-methyl-2-oxoglutarate aldolase
MAANLSQEQLERLRAIDSPTIANAIEPFKVRDRTVGFTGLDTRCLFPGLGVMLGYAVTALVDTTTPGNVPQGRTFLPFWEAIAASPKPAILVFQDVGPRRSHSAHFGEMMCNTAIRLGGIGLVCSGGVRDLNEVSALGFHYFAPGAVVSHGMPRCLEVNVPVTVDGLRINPGDLLHGDLNGLVLIPEEIADQVADEADRVRERERAQLEFLQGPEFSIDALRARSIGYPGAPPKS